MNKLGMTLQIGAATCAVATTAVLTPLPTAQAADAPGSIGGSAGAGAELISPTCDPSVPPGCLTTFAPLAPSAAALPALPGGHTILQNPLWWFGPPNSSPPTQTPVFTFQPLNLIPGFLRPLFSWFADINYEVCIAGLTLQIGPYGTIAGSYSRGCA